MGSLNNELPSQVRLWDPQLANDLLENESFEASRPGDKIKADYNITLETVGTSRFHFIPKQKDEKWSMHVISNISSYLNEDTSEKRVHPSFASTMCAYTEEQKCLFCSLRHSRLRRHRRGSLCQGVLGDMRLGPGNTL